VQRFWDILIAPLLDALRPQTVAEVGAESGAVTMRLLEWASTREATVHSVDPAPTFDPEHVDIELAGALRFHRARSLEVLEAIGAVDLALLDGDHNWYTVVNELRLLERCATTADRRPPLVLLHDVGWPYARRDLYYDPRSIPPEHRHRYARRGIVPEWWPLGEPGLNAHLRNATSEGGPGNGVLTAAEDFIGESPNSWTLLKVPGLHGLGILTPTELIEDHGRVRDLLDGTQTAEFLHRQCELIEQARIKTEIGRAKLSKDLQEAQRASAQALEQRIEEDDLRPGAEEPAELTTLRRALARAQANLREADAERVELEAELERKLRQGRTARRHERELKAEAGERAAELEAAGAELAHAKERLRAREQQLETARLDLGKLETANDALQAAYEELQADRRQLVADHAQLQTDRAELQTDYEQLQATEERLKLQLQGSEQRDDQERRATEERLNLRLDAAHEELQAALAHTAVHEQEVGRLSRELEIALGARHRSESEIAELREAFEAQADELRAELHRRQRSEAQARGELVELGSELELAAAQRERLHDALARARVDAEVADAERAVFERQVSELTALLERAANGYTAVARDESSSAGGLAPVGLPGSEGSAPGSVEEPPTGGAVDVWVAEPASSPIFEAAGPEEYVADWPLLPTAEFQAQAGFVAEYRAAVDLDPDRPAMSDPTTLPSPIDRRGVLVGPGENQVSHQPSVDVIITVHDALEDLRMCLWSLVHKTERRFRLIIVNDGSAAAATDFLEDLARQEPALTLIHRADPPHGYTMAANAGLRACRSDYVVLLNSDTIVTPGWLERIVAYGERHDRIGVLGPLSNAAGHQSVPHRREAGEWATNPLPDWITADGVALLVRQLTPEAEARLPFINGFCYVIRRAVIDAIGHFDEELFRSGYCEENDYSQRARDAGFELGVVDDAYVFHAKSRSYGTARSLDLRRHNYELFLNKHGRERIQELVRAMEDEPALAPLRGAVGLALSDPALAAEAIVRNPLSIVFVLPGLAEGGSGGSHSIYQEVHGLRKLGATARIALKDSAWDRASRAYKDAPDIIETFADIDQLAAITAHADVIVATHFKSVELVTELQRRRDGFLAAYYVQDYEPFFFSADPAERAEAEASYDALPGGFKFAKTHWLCNVIGERRQTFVAKVEPSIDEQLFHPRGRTDDPGELRIVAMIRPRTPRRQPFSTVSVLERLLAAFGSDVSVMTFGCQPQELEKITRSTVILEGHAGLLSREQVADLFRQSDVFLDMSMYQAFGRTALEAMACGATAVIPRVGGACEFAVDNENALIVDTLDREAAFTALGSLVADRDRLARLQTRARETASRYSIMRAALSEYVAMHHAHRARFGAR
jgi:GT2 family glycosyltransferase/glycosyltransferase involved in cell wall biosynthesis